MADYYNTERDYTIREAFEAEYALDAPCFGTADCKHHEYEIKAIKNFYKNMMLYKIQGDYEKQFNLTKKLCFFVKGNLDFFNSHYDIRIELVESLTELIANERASSLRALLQGAMKCLS
jgi:hypothetical protein